MVGKDIATSIALVCGMNYVSDSKDEDLGDDRGMAPAMLDHPMEFSMAQKGEDLGMRHGHEALAAIKIW
jgi:hypothetical protein